MDKNIYIHSFVVCKNPTLYQNKIEESKLWYQGFHLVHFPSFPTEDSDQAPDFL